MAYSKAETADFDLLEDLYKNYSRRAYAFALKILHNSEMAEDAVHEAFLRYYRNPQSFDINKGHFISWFLTIVRNICLDQLRKTNNKNGLPSNLEKTSEPQVLENIPDDNCNTEEEVWIKIQQKNIQLALKTITAQQKQLIELAFFNGLTHSQIAVVTGLPLGTVKSRIRQGLLKLKDQLASDK